MRTQGHVAYSSVVKLILGLLLLGGCSDQGRSPVEPPDTSSRHLQPTFLGETAVKIMINGQPLTNPTLAARLRVEMAIDAGRPTFAGNNLNKTVQISPIHTQASIVQEWNGQGSYEGNVFYDDLWGNVTPGAHRGTIADGDYTVKLLRDGETLVSSKAIAVNHANTSSGNGTFLDEASDQTITFFLDSNLNQQSSPTVTNTHARASTHLSATIIQPAASDTTISVGQSLTVKGSASNGLNGKKYAWDWNAAGTNQETFDTEFSTSNTASHTYVSTGEYKIRLIVRDGNDNPFSGSRGGHYAVSATKTVHVVDAPPAPVTSVEISPSAATLDPGFVVQLDAILRDASGNILTGRTVNWTTSDPAIVTVPSQGDPVTATAQGGGIATITATSEGVNGYATITVNTPADDAAAAGNTLPASIINGDFVSVTISMRNTGGTTWTSAANYVLSISQGYEYWVPGIDLLTSSVSPGVTHIFAFDLGLDHPYHTGNTACYHRMDHAGFFFGEENGRFINVIGGDFLSSEAVASMQTESMMEDVADPQPWLVGARATKPMRFGPGDSELDSGEAQLLTYRYQHAVPRAIDVVFRIVVDPNQAEILPPQVEAGGTALTWQVATVAPGEYWVRLTGTLPAGTGSIGSFLVRVNPGQTGKGILGTVTLHYPGS